MATVAFEADLAEKTLLSVMKRYDSPQSYRTLPIFDPASGNYLLLDEGWEKYGRIHRVWAHIEVRDGKFWIHEDGTEEGIAILLLKEGIAPEQIVLAFHDPVLREATDFAVA